MFISIVIPLYNKEETISRAIKSILNQTHQNFEIIIVNDGSTDSSLEKVNNFADSRIKLIVQPNKGVSAARNEGVRHAKSEWVAFLDADDEYMPRFAESVTTFIRQHTSHNLSFVASNLFYSDTGLTAFSNMENGIYNYFELCKNDQTPATSSSTAVCRDLFIKAGGFPEGIKQFEDWNLWCKLAWLGEFGFIAEPLSYYHISKTGTASTIERNINQYYEDLMLLPRMIRGSILTGRINNEGICDSWKYVNAYIIGQARALRRKGHRWMGLRLLRELNIKYLDVRLIFMILKSLILMLLPPGLRKFTRRFSIENTSNN